MPERQTWQVETPGRLDHWLVGMWPWLDRQSVRELIRSRAVEVNGRLALKAGQYVQPGDQVTLVPLAPPMGSSEDRSEGVPAFEPLLPVLYEDDALVIVDKPAYLAMRPTPGSTAASVLTLLSEQYPALANVGAVGQAGVVSRLEEGVSGPVLAAKDESAFRATKHLMARQEMETSYTALVEGQLSGEGLIDAPLRNSGRVREWSGVAREGRVARTAYRVQRHLRDQERDYTLVLLLPESNRLHQLRVHMAYYGCPIVGDRRYGSRRQTLLQDRIFLHLSALKLPHPLTGEMLTIGSSLPAELNTVLQYLLRPRR